MFKKLLNDNWVMHRIDSDKKLPAAASAFVFVVRYGYILLDVCP